MKELNRDHDVDRVILGDGPECIFSTNTNETGINNNILVVGASGSGKTVSITEAFLIETYRRSIITTVTKRRIVDKYTSLLERRGYDVWDLDFVHPKRGNVGYDPLDFISSYMDITFVARSIVLANQQKKYANIDPYWNEAATSLLTAIISYVLMTKDDATFSDVLEMLDNLTFEEYEGHICTNYDKKFQELEEKDSSNFAVSNWKSFVKIPLKTASCVFGILNTTIDSVFNPELREMFSMEKKIDYERLAQNRTALFVTSSPVNPSLHCFINMFYAHTFKQLFEFAEEQPDGKLPIPVHLLADDFGTGCPVPLFDQYISIFREKQISVTIVIQSEAQLYSLYGSNEATTIINNCDSYVFFGSNDLYTAKNMSIRANKTIDECLHMKVGTEILFRRGDKPKIGKRYNIFKNDIYRKVTEEYQQYITDEEPIKM